MTHLWRWLALALLIAFLPPILFCISVLLPDDWLKRFWR